MVIAARVEAEAAVLSDASQAVSAHVTE